MNDLKEFYGPNAGYVLELFERYLKDPDSVDTATRNFFENWSPPPENGQVAQKPVAVSSPAILPSVEQISLEKVTAAANLALSIHSYGHLAARLDPLGTPPPGDPCLELSSYRLSEDDLRSLPPQVIGGPVGEDAKNALEGIQCLKAIYANTVGYEYKHIQISDERQWLESAAECGSFRPPQDPIDLPVLLQRLTQVETFEHFLHRIFPGKTRFSIEGVDMLVPMLDEAMGLAVQAGICTIPIGMAHRGRLNVLAHIMGKPYELILAEFRDPVGHFSTRAELGWTGDVKYHKGAQRAVEGDEQVKLVVSMPPNPSHLEYIDPVLVGMARAAGSKVDQPGPPKFFSNASLPVIVHGDASFPGQGIVAETLNLSRLPGYAVGGTLHIITNNQLGYTTDPENSRSTFYASDLAKGFEIPIMHVNADDPQACLEAIRTAFAYRQQFQKDFLIDLIGYRRYGHNEGDEPTFTQPLMYERIEKHPTVRQILADELVKHALITPEQPEALVQQQMNALQEILSTLEGKEESLERELSPHLEPPPRGAARRVKTALPFEELCELNESLLQLPPDFHLHRKLTRAMQKRRAAFDDPESLSIDWATAEELALASILAAGTPIRLTGEDVARGTFSQRHAVFHDTVNGQIYSPLQKITQAKAAFEVIDSPLSENAAIAFEFGYNIQAPRRLVIWEAQYGDFINTAQAVIDEFIVSARAKWEQTPSIVFLLPHANEGQGPDHSSGRPERFLQLATGTNLRLANCTTAAQYFHLLRRQAALLENDPLPLVIMTPKSLLRHPLVASPPRELAEGRWLPVIDDPQASQHVNEITRVVLCSGKIFIDLVTDELRPANPQVALVRLEQLYPFRPDDLVEVLDKYPNLKEIVWVQEEPRNMGAWTYLEPLLLQLINGRWPLEYLGRPASASPAEGSFAWHSINQKEIITKAYQPK